MERLEYLKAYQQCLSRPPVPWSRKNGLVRPTGDVVVVAYSETLLDGTYDTFDIVLIQPAVSHKDYEEVGRS